MTTMTKNFHKMLKQQKMDVSSWVNSFVFLLLFIHTVTGTCDKLIPDSQGLHQVKCSCPHSSLDLEITPEQSMKFLNASSLEIFSCRNVTLHSNLFRKANHLRQFSVSKVNNLIFDPALSLPDSLNSFSLSHIGFLDHFPAPGPYSSVLHSLMSLDLFSLNNVTVMVPSNDTAGSFIDLPIANVHLSEIKFFGTISKALLHFNGASLNQFSATKCHFDDMDEHAFFVQSKGNVTIEGCKFESLSHEAMKVHGQCITISDNSFESLDGSHAVSVQGKLHAAIMHNSFKNLRAPHAFLLNTDENAYVYIEDNQLPCNCFADYFIPPPSRKVDVSNCGGDVSLSCALQKKQFCIRGNGKNESIPISKHGLPPCPAPEPKPHTGSGNLLQPNYLRQSFILYITIYLMMTML